MDTVVGVSLSCRIPRLTLHGPSQRRYLGQGVDKTQTINTLSKTAQSDTNLLVALHRSISICKRLQGHAGFASLTRARLQTHRYSRVPPSTFGPCALHLCLGGYSIPAVHSVSRRWGCGFAVQLASSVGDLCLSVASCFCPHPRSCCHTMRERLMVVIGSRGPK